MFSVKVLAVGYSRMEDGFMKANCTCTLVRGPGIVMVVDTMTAWDRDKLVKALADENISPDDVTHCIATHGHYDHVGNMNLFQKAEWHVVGFTVFQPPDKCYLHPFEANEPLYLTEDKNIVVMPTPGHTLSCVSVLVKGVEGMGTVAIAGDLFEREEDIAEPKLWAEAGSEDSGKQEENRLKVAELADWIVPGHGPMFRVEKQYIDSLARRVSS